VLKGTIGRTKSILIKYVENDIKIKPNRRKMNYEKIYNDLISKARSEDRKRTKGIYYEGHHIIPKCMGGEGRTKDSTHPNIILLTAKEHYMAHRFLCMIYPTNNKLFYALWRMINHKGSRTNKRYIPGSRIYARLREDVRNARLGTKWSQETKQKISEGLSKFKGEVDMFYVY
jgi:hypothetical protein